MSELAVLNKKGEKVGSVALDDKVFGGKVNKPLMHQAVVNYLANQRQGNAATKTVGETRGGGKKPWRQKGTGRARAGSIRSPLWRGGGVVFGPHPRDYSYSCPKKIRRKALVNALSSKLNDNAVIAVESLSVDKPKTKDFINMLKDLKIAPPALLVSAVIDRNTLLASRNIKGVSIRLSSELNAYDILKCEKLVITKDALERLAKAAELGSSGDKPGLRAGKGRAR